MTHTTSEEYNFNQEVHPWLQHMSVVYIPGLAPSTLADKTARNILEHFHRLGNKVQNSPDNNTSILLTTAPYGEPLSWRDSLQLVARGRYKLDYTPIVFTLVHIQSDELARMLAHFERALEKKTLDAADFDFPGLAENAHQVLYEQGRRGGPILALERLLQAQAKCLNLLLLVGDEKPEGVYHFDLVGAYPYSGAKDEELFYRDIVLRMATRVSANEITTHVPQGEPIPKAEWDLLVTPHAMYHAARQLDKRGFFTEMVRISDLVQVPAVEDAISSQYSEGCFATWDTQIGALITTITGSARPVNKGSLREDDLAVITGVRADYRGALVRHIQGKPNYPPSSEAVEMIEMDHQLPMIALENGAEARSTVPVIRSKLHGHRGISAFHPRYVEFVSLDPPYFHYPVTCGTDAQARGISQAFTRSQALNNPGDPRQVVFTVLPTHGVVIAEKWVPGKQPFQTIWEYFDAGHLEPDRQVPQGPFVYEEVAGKMVLSALEGRSGTE
jgi:hypothetical protein